MLVTALLYGKRTTQNHEWRDRAFERARDESMVIRLASVLALTALSAAPLAGCASSTSSPPPAKTAEATPHVDGATAKKLVGEGARLLDVRTPEEYAEKHIDRAENVPVDTVGDRTLGPKDAPLVVYCGSGGRSARAAETLRSKGYTRVYDLGGMSNWDK